MRVSSKGFVLLVLLVHMQALFLFILLSFSTVGQGLLQASLAAKMDRLSIRGESILLHLERQGVMCASVDMLSSDELKTMPRSWWLKNAYSGFDRGNRYFLVREKMKVNNSNDTNRYTKQSDRCDIYRNTLLYESGVNATRSALLQSHVAFRDGAFLRRLSYRLLW